jgi:hypothetical protein
VVALQPKPVDWNCAAHLAKRFVASSGKRIGFALLLLCSAFVEGGGMAYQPFLAWKDTLPGALAQYLWQKHIELVAYLCVWDHMPCEC